MFATSSEKWRRLVDRVPVAELLDQVLHESAYASELRGTQSLQASENVKKIRALIRRLQNRGYATMSRVASHLDHLAAADEANAPIEASNAVNLMTVHASKGLEFPVVFVVNLNKGTSPSRDPIRVVADPSVDLVSVSVGDFTSEADDDSIAKDREETKRLLYVALTRARDRLYLGSVVTDGRIHPGRGSLAEVLPASLLHLLEATEKSVWASTSGDGHAFVRCVPSAAGTQRSVEVDLQPRPIDRQPLGGPPRIRPVRTHAEVAAPSSVSATVEQLVGRGVHRLLESRGVAPLPEDDLRQPQQAVVQTR